MASADQKRANGRGGDAGTAMTNQTVNGNVVVGRATRSHVQRQTGVPRGSRR